MDLKLMREYRVVKQHSKSGTALLLVVLITTALTLIATSFYWVSSFMRLTAIEHVNHEKICLLSDSLAEYAQSLLGEKLVDFSGNHYQQEFYWPPQYEKDFSGLIEITGSQEKAHVLCSLLRNEKVIQKISFEYYCDESQSSTENWHRS